jgi:hypothetical protein
MVLLSFTWSLSPRILKRAATDPETRLLHSYDPWKGRGTLGWESGSVWHHPFLPPLPPETPTSALRVRPYRRPEVRRRAGCTQTTYGTVRGPLVGDPATFGTTCFRRPHLQRHPRRHSTTGHPYGRGTSHSAHTCNAIGIVSWPLRNLDKMRCSGGGVP